MVHGLLLSLKIILTLIIILAVSVLYMRINISEVRFRLSFLILAFISFLIALLFHVFVIKGFFSELSLFYEHVFGVVFFVLLGSTGLLHFLEEKYKGIVAKVTYAFVGAVLLISIVIELFAFYRGVSYRISTGEIIFIHLLQLGILLLVTGIILRKIMVTNSYLTPLTLHRRYPFGIAAVLMMFAVAAHTGSITFSRPPTHFISFFESVLVLPALAIIAAYIIFSYKTQINLYGHLHKDRCDCEYCRIRKEYREVWSVVEALNHVIRQVYYTPVDVGIGGREVLFSEFLNSTGLAPLFSKTRMEFKKTTFLSVPQKYELLYNISKKILEFFVSHREMVNEAQLYYLVNFLNSIYVRRGNRPLDFKPHWILLSKVVRTLGSKANEQLETLSHWDGETTFSFFEDQHPTGILILDKTLGGLETHQFLLNITSEVSGTRILYSMIRNSLDRWRNVVYLTSDPAAKILNDLQDMVEYLQNNRLFIISLMNETAEEGGLVRFSSLEELLENIRKGISEFPLSTVFLVIDLNPIAISFSPPRLHAFIKKLTAMRFEEKLVVCALVTKNIPPLSMDILREEADVVLMHRSIAGKIVTDILKPETVPQEPLEGDLFQVLKVVYEENNRGRKPSISEISKALSITPKTARKRIKALLERNLVEIEKSGRYRVVKITEEGRQKLITES